MPLNLTVGKELLKFANIGAKAVLNRIANRDDSERFIQNALSAMPGAPAKIGQLLGMRDASMIPTPTPMSIEEVKEIILHESPKLASEIEFLSPWSKTASIGQIHQARLKSGETVAVKVQYPEIRPSLSAQIDIIFGLAAYSPAKNYEFDVKGTKHYLGAKLLEETDYLHEASIQKKFYGRYNGSAIVVAKVFDEYSTSKLLVQSWEESLGIDEAKKQMNEAQSTRAGVILTAFLFDSAFGLGQIHTDMNPSNFGFRIVGESIQLVLYDFGSTQAFSQEHGIGLYRWLEATRTRNGQLVFDRLVDLGFAEERLNPIKDRLLKLSDALLLPLQVDDIWSSTDWQLQHKIDESLGQDKWWFRTAGPPWFLYMMRSMQGWHYAVERLNCKFNMRQLWWPWEQQLHSFAAFTHKENTPTVRVATPNQSSGIELAASSLKVSVTEGDEEIVGLTLPARAIEDLETLLPDHVAEKCLQDGIDLIAIKERAIKSGGHPQELFTASHGVRHYRVWLA